MGFFTQKRQIDTVSLISVTAASVFITFLSMWLYYNGKLSKMQSSYETKVEIFKNQIETIKNKNTELQAKLDKVREVMGTDGDNVPEPVQDDTQK
ncbi:MAG: hypothetical protein JXN63_07120 [Candidatus Delongbacteria bacterium]|nr:hypothetical protein [Candidatus Delongbacteria bacterium]